MSRSSLLHLINYHSSLFVASNQLLSPSAKPRLTSALRPCHSASLTLCPPLRPRILRPSHGWLVLVSFISQQSLSIGVGPRDKFHIHVRTIQLCDLILNSCNVCASKGHTITYSIRVYQTRIRHCTSDCTPVAQTVIGLRGNMGLAEHESTVVGTAGSGSLGIGAARRLDGHGRAITRGSNFRQRRQERDV
jgi:hypothetical protein